ncbi:hypothetical protein KQX54_014306 [Cotesia glomerata]|uniref:Uncharacterized protein n=1 Tax=Cotesia glomerata TaxID=32391 RepID=A0AAV7ISR9_COTGL|nr:hypothetical protein KQX54_014306 [Cotesia glomerata]
MYLRSRGLLTDDTSQRTPLSRGRGSRQHQGVHGPENLASTSTHGLNEQQRMELERQLDNHNRTTSVQNSSNGHLNQQTAHTEQANGDDRQGEEDLELFSSHEDDNLPREELTPRMSQWVTRMESKTRRLYGIVAEQIEINRQNRAHIQEVTRLLTEPPLQETPSVTVWWEGEHVNVLRPTRPVSAPTSSHDFAQCHTSNVQRPPEQLRQLADLPRQQQNSQQHVNPPQINQQPGDLQQNPGMPSQAGFPNMPGFHSFIPLQCQMEDYDRWKNIKDSFQMAGLYFPQLGMLANDFVNVLEARANREGWTESELLKVLRPEDPVESRMLLRDKTTVPGFSAITIPGNVFYDNRYGVQRRVNNPNTSYNQVQSRYQIYRPRVPATQYQFRQALVNVKPLIVPSSPAEICRVSLLSRSTGATAENFRENLLSSGMPAFSRHRKRKEFINSRVQDFLEVFGVKFASEVLLHVQTNYNKIIVNKSSFEAELQAYVDEGQTQCSADASFKLLPCYFVHGKSRVKQASRALYQSPVLQASIKLKPDNKNRSCCILHYRYSLQVT